MKKLTLMAAMMAAALGATAGADALPDSVQVTSQGCQAGRNGYATSCALTITYTGDQDSVGVRPCGSDINVITSAGDSVAARDVNSANNSGQCLYSNVYKGIPLKLSANFADVAPKNFVKLSIGGKLYSVNAVTPAPAPSPAPVTNVNLSNYNAALTGCRTTGTTITCTGATLTPKR